MNIKAIILAFWLFLASGVGFGQGLTNHQQEQMISVWVVSVEGETRDRTLRIKTLTPKTEGGFTVDATYGYVGEGQGAVRANLLQQGQDVYFLLTTQSSSRINASQKTAELFQGTFTDPVGTVKALKMVKVSDEELQRRIETSRNEKTAKPSQDVPESCARFFGGWAGTWSQGSFGPLRLWVTAIMPDCTVKYSYRETSSSDMPTVFRNGEIKQGVLTLSCGSGGSCIFERKGEELWGRYHNPSGGSNTGTFKKISSQ